jgi:DNA-binding transcriptional LysR family regulator
VNLHHLRVFLAVAESGSVSRAAERLHISQPAVSVQLKRLEDEVGLPLLAPEGRGIRLTETGQAVAAHARRLFALERELEQDLTARREGRRGLLRVGTTHLPAGYLVPAWAAHFKQQAPDVDLQTLSGNTRAIFDHLHRYEVDLAIMAGGWEEPGIDREVLLDDALWFVAAPGHRWAGRSITLAELAREPLILREEGSSTRQRLLALFETAGLRPLVGLTFAGMEATVKAVETGYGVTVLPSLAARAYIDRGLLARVCLAGHDLPFSLFLCTRSGEPPAPAALRFMSLVREFSAGLTPAARR